MIKNLFATLILLHSASSLHVNLYHRILVPANLAESSPFTYKGTVDLDSNPFLNDLAPAEPSYLPSDAQNDDISTFLTTLDDPSSALYQVALELPDTYQDSWPFTSVKACHLPNAHSERIWLHASSGVPHSLSYWVSDIPSGGACRHFAKSQPLDIASWDTTVTVKSPSSPPSPQLRVPPQLSAEGKPIEPVPEKTFLQKYWMHLLGGFLLLTFLAPAPEEEGQRQGGGNGGQSR